MHNDMKMIAKYENCANKSKKKRAGNVNSEKMLNIKLNEESQSPKQIEKGENGILTEIL